MADASSNKRRTFRKFSYRGVDLEQLLDVSSEEFMGLVSCRARRRFKRGLKQKPMGLIKKLRASKKDVPTGEKPEVVKTHLRNMIIVPEMIGSIVGIYNGKTFNQVEIKPDMIGHYLGEFSITYKPVKHGRPGMGATHSSRFIPLNRIAMDDPAETLDAKAELDQEELARLVRENRALKGRLDELERENRLLKQRNYDLSMRYGRSAENRRQPFELAFVGGEDNDLSSAGSDHNELGGNMASVEESESGREGHSRTESMSGSCAGRPEHAPQPQAPEEPADDADDGDDGFPARKEKTPERARRAADATDADTEAARERRGVLEGEERHGGARRKEARQLKCYAELEGHAGAIYSAQYAPAGGLVASASFDKTVRIWDVGEQKAAAVLEGHRQSVFDVAWRGDSAAVTSAGFDRSCIEWDLETRAAGRRMECDGLVQCVRYSTHNPRVVYAGDSSGVIWVHDTRQAQSAAQLPNGGAMVNTIYCFNDETRLVSGDRNGEIKMWDVRIGRFMRLIGGGGGGSSERHQAISHISVVRNEQSGTEFMAASSYDNVLRVYDQVDDSSVPTPRVIHELRGIPSRNWPIRNAFLDPSMAQGKLVGLYDNDDYYELDMRSQSEARGLRSMLFLLTGSAEPFAYMYRLNTHPKTVRSEDKAQQGIRQRLEGHSDRVYAVATHPAEIKGCTAGADGTIRLWHIPSAGRLL